MRLFVLTMLVLALTLSAFAQGQQADGDKLVYVPQKYVSAEGLTHQASPTSSVANVLGWGKEIGTAMNEGLAAVVDQAERFGTTKVGNFVMVMIAWKVIGKDMVGIILGIPILIAGICIWMWALRRFFIGYRVVVGNPIMKPVWLMVGFGVLATVAFAQSTSGPFGLRKGMTQQQVIEIVGKSAVKEANGDTLRLLTVPKPHPAFEFYSLIVSPIDGLLKITAYGNDIKTNGFGEAVRNSFTEIRDALSRTYDKPDVRLGFPPGRKHLERAGRLDDGVTKRGEGSGVSLGKTATSEPDQ